MPATEFAHAIWFGSETLTSRMPGQTPRMPRLFLGAPATAAVSVPCAFESGKPPMVWRWPPWNSGWLTSAVASTSASSGLVSVTGGGTRLGSTIARAPGGAGVERVGRRRPAASGARAGSARRREQELGRAPFESSRARPRGDDVGAGAEAPRAVAGGDGVGRRAGRGADDPVRGRGGAGVARAAPSAASGQPGRAPRGRARAGAVRRGSRRMQTTVGTPSAQDRSGVPARTARKSAGREAVSLLAVLVVEPGQHAEHGGGADRVAPLERAARVVEAEHHAGVDVLRRRRRPRRARSTPR